MMRTKLTMKSAFLCGWLALSGVVMGQQGPGWVNAGAQESPELDGASLTVTTYGPMSMAFDAFEDDGGGSETSAAPILTAGNEADVITPEIQELADGLLHDPQAIFQWVMMNISYTHYYGLRKGAALTLLEGSGNDADTSALLVALLRASGVPARYRSGYCLIPLSGDANGLDLQHWLEVDPVAAVMESFFYYRGTPTTDLSYQTDTHGARTGSYFLRRVWVEADIAGGHPWFDPSFKTLTHVAGVNLATASGYDRSALLTSAGGTVSGAAVNGLNETALGNYLRDRTTALLSYIQTNLPNQPVVNLTGGYVQAPTPTNTFPLPYVNDTTLQTWESVPTTMFSTVRMLMGTIDRTLKLAELHGQRLSLVFDSMGKGQIYLDDTLLVQETAGASGSVQMTVWLDHPGGTILDQNDSTAPRNYLRTGSYALVYGCEMSQRWLWARQAKLEAYRAAGLADTSREVKTETLNVMGINWLLQTQLAEHMLADMGDMAHTYHHRWGRMADEYNTTTGLGGYYVDVWMQYSGLRPRHAGQDFESLDVTGSFVDSAMEHGVIAQTQSGAPAASTVKLASVANSAGQKLFLADSTNWSTVQPQLTGYGTADATAIAAAISGGNTVLLPQAGNLTVQQWHGAGYVTLKTNADGSYFNGMLISGNYSGGYSGYIAPVSTFSVITGQMFSAPKLNFTPVTLELTTGGDPVDMLSGQFVHQATDLVVGGGAAPRGLTFSRNYHGGRKLRNDAGIGYGWNHNLNLLAVPRSDVETALGLGTPQQAAAAAAGLYAAWDVFKNRANVKDWSTSLLIAKWVVDRLQDNVVSVALSDRVVEFSLQPDGTYSPPPGVTLSLTKDGSGNFVAQERHGDTHQFNSAGKLSTVTDLWGRTQTFVYDGSGRLTSVTDCYGRALTLSYNGAGLLTGVTDGLGRSVSFTYGTDQTLTQATDAEGKNTNFVYDTAKRLTALKNHANQTLVSNGAFDVQDRILTQYSAGDSAKAWHYYYAEGQTVEVDPLGGSITHYFDGRKRNIGHMDALGRLTTVTYDGQDHAIAQSSPLGNTVQATYDASQNLIESRDALNLSASATYDGQQRLTQTVDRNSKTTLFQNYNAQFQAQRIIDASGVVTDQTFYSSGSGIGMPATLTVGGELKATYTYASTGELLRTTFPTGDYIENSYNAWGDVTGVRNARGFTTTSSYNARRQVLSTTSPGSQAGDAASVASQTYDGNVNVATQTSPRGQTTSHTYTVQGKRLSSTLPGGAVVTQHYDARNWLDTTTDATGLVTTFLLDAAGQRTPVKDVLNHTLTTSYDGEGRAWLNNDPLNHATQTQFTARGEAEAVIFADHTTATPDYVFRVFDSAGRMLQMYNRRGALWQFGYDDTGRGTVTQSPLGRQWTKAYDTQGRVQTLTEPSGQSVTQVYDVRNRVSSRTFKNTGGSTDSVVGYTYDANCNVLTTTEGTNVLTRTYDQRDRVLTYTNAQSEQVGYRYDASGNLVQVIYPGSKAVTYTYDNRERLSTITDWSARVSTLTWDGAGRLLNVTRPNGTYREYQYDGAGRMMQVSERNAGKRGICVVRMELDAAGRPTQKLTLPQPQAVSGVPAVSATYDADNRMATLLGYGIPYDGDGNMTAIFLPLGVYPAASLGWDTRNRLTTVSQPVYTGGVLTGNNQTQHVYDAEGNRTQSTFNSQTTRYTVNPHGLSGMSEVLIEHRPDSTARWYVWGGPAGLLYESQTDSSGADTAVRYYHSDQAGSTFALTDSSANVTGRIEYTAYGLVTHTSGVVDTPYRFNGMLGVMTDSQTGLIQMRARWYHPWLGRFVSEDPAQFSGGNNWHAFTSGDPLLSSDPSGLTESSQGSNVNWEQMDTTAMDAEARQYAFAKAVAEDPLMAIERQSYKQYSTIPAIDPVDLGVGLMMSASRSLGRSALAEEAAGIGATGEIGESALRQLGGESQVFFRTSQGGRYIDQLVDGIANEAKVGYQSLTPEIRLQMMKDVELIQTQQVQGAVWNFFQSPVTGKIGPSGPLGNLLNSNNIPYTLHY